MGKLGTKTYYKKKADTLISKIVRARGKCDKCGRGSDVQLQCAHIVGRNNHTLRFDLMNTLCLCAGCHRWAHDNPDAFTDFWRKNFPHKQIYLDDIRHQITKRTALDYKALVEILQDTLQEKLGE